MTLNDLMEPAQPASSYDGASGGYVLVAAQFTLTNTSAANENSDANNDANVVGSNGQDYTASFSSIAGCTNFNSGDWSLNPGQSLTGCVAFQVPAGVTVSQVDFAPSMNMGGSDAEWTIT